MSSLQKINLNRNNNHHHINNNRNKSDQVLYSDESDFPESQYFSYEDASEISGTDLLLNMKEADLPVILTKIFQKLNFICQKVHCIEKSQGRIFKELKVLDRKCTRLKKSDKKEDMVKIEDIKKKHLDEIKRLGIAESPELSGAEGIHTVSQCSNNVQHEQLVGIITCIPKWRKLCFYSLSCV